MITLGQLAEYHINEMTGGRPNNDDQYDVRIVAGRIRPLLNELLLQQVRTNYGSDDRAIPGTYKVPYHNIRILTEEETGRKYIPLPDFFLSLPYNKGLNDIRYTKDPNSSFFERPMPGVTMNLHKSPLSPRQSYYQESMRVYFDREDVDERHKEVTVVLVVAAPDKYGLDDVLPLTAEMASRVKALLKERSIPIMPQDQLSDNKALNAQ